LGRNNAYRVVYSLVDIGRYITSNV